IASYNNNKWYDKNVGSVLSQDYENYRAIYIDDCSPDGTGELVSEYLEKNDQNNRVTLIRNENRVGAMENLYNAIHSCQDDEIIVTLDGDDWFAHSQVLQHLNRVYTDPNVWMSYGQYRSWPDNGLGCCINIPANVIDRNMYRTFRWCS